MTAAIQFLCPVVGGRLPERDAKRIAEVLRKLDGKRVVLSIEEVKKRRSDQQNRYYWGCIVKHITDGFRDAGNMVNAEDVHDFLKSEVGKLSQVLVTADGEVFRGPGSTAKLTKAEFTDYIEAVRAWAAQVLDLMIPSPDEALQQSTEENEHGRKH